VNPKPVTDVLLPIFLCGDAREILVLKVCLIAIALQNIQVHVLSKTEALNRGPK